MEDVQYKASRLQHHIHPVNPKTGQREPLSSCLSTSHGKECKHGFPKKAQLTDKPLIVCEGIARERGLPLKGNRGMLGCTLGRRTCDSKNGTSKAFSAALPWCNSDVSPDIRVPLISETHDPRCTGDCVGRASLRTVAREAQSAATRTAGYFGGYIGKAQPKFN